MSGRGENLAVPQRKVVLWAALEQVAYAELALSRFLALWVEAGAAEPLNRVQFVTDDVGAVHRPAAVAARVGAGLELRWPLNETNTGRP
jgi:hypothetical protein